MRYIFIILSLCISLSVQSQSDYAAKPDSNRLLLSSFWQTKPGADAVKAEVARGSNPAETTSGSVDAVMLALISEAPNESILYLLEQKGNTVDKIVHGGLTYISWAAYKGNVEIMQHLIAKGAKVNNIKNETGITPLTLAAGNGQLNLKVYELLEQNGVDIAAEKNGDGANALLLAVGFDSTFKLTEYFQSKGLDLKSKDADGRTAFDYAARAGNIKMMDYLLNRGVRYSDQAIIMAAQAIRRGTGNNLEVFTYLEKIGVNIPARSKTGENALHYVVRRSKPEVVRYFLDKGVDPNQLDADGNTAFVIASSYAKDASILSLLVPGVKDINQANAKGVTALTNAVRLGTPQAIEYLIAQGANIQVTDVQGNNLVYHAFDTYTPRQVKEFEAKLDLLKTKGLSVTAPQKDGNTLYHLAIAKKDLALLKLIARYDVDVNVKNKEGLTALHKAAMLSKDGALMQYLVSIGAQKELKTTLNETAFDLAKENELLAKMNVAIDFLK